MAAPNFESVSTSPYLEFAASNTQSFTVPNSLSNSILIVAYSVESTGNNETISSLTYNSVSLTKLDAKYHAASYGGTEVWYMLSPPSGAHNLFWQKTDGTSRNVIISGLVYSGVDQTYPFTNPAHFTDVADSLSLTLTSTTSGNLVLDVMGGQDTGATPAFGSGQTSRIAAATSLTEAGISQKAAGGSISMSQTDNGSLNSGYIVFELSAVIPKLFTNKLRATQAIKRASSW